MTTTYLEDLPAKQPDFNYTLVAKALTPILLRKSDAAVVIGIHGQWGAGKTTLMRALEQELRDRLIGADAIYIQFNAWKYQDRQALWRALILRVLGELRTDGENAAKLDELEESLYRSFAIEEHGPWKVNWRILIVETIGLLLSLVRLDFIAKVLRESTGFLGRVLTFGAGSRDNKDGDKNGGIDTAQVEKLASVLERSTVQRQVVQVQSIEQFLTKFSSLMTTSSAVGRRVFVFIDDLDRCLPESALEIFEAIKLFLDAPGCGYVVALDRDVIRKGLLVKYSQQMQAGTAGLLINADEYIEKTISLSFDLPRLSAADALTLINQYQLPITLDAEHHGMIFAALGANPRRVKRFMNSLSVQLQLAALLQKSGSSVEVSLVASAAPEAARRFDFFLKLSLLAYKHSGLFGLALRDPGLLGRLQRIGNAYRTTTATDAAKARVDRNQALSSEPSLLGEIQSDEEFWQLMAGKPNLLDDADFTGRLVGWFRESGAAGAIGTQR